MEKNVDRGADRDLGLVVDLVGPGVALGLDPGAAGACPAVAVAVAADPDPDPDDK